MKITDYILPLIMAYLTIWGVQYYFGWGYSQEGSHATKTEQHFVAPVEQKNFKPLKKEIDFYDEQIKTRSEITTITTEWGAVEFSTLGASIESIEFFQDKEYPIRTIFPSLSENKTEKALLIAFDQQTPLAYKLLAREEGQKQTILSYQVHTPQVTVLKKFILYHEMHKIDMILDIVPAQEMTFDFVRIVWPSPVMSENVAYNVISSIAINNKDVFEKKPAASLDIQQGWFAPKLFGSDNKYFAHVLLNSSDGAVARSYYKQTDAHQLQSIIELPTINQPVSFEYSFYFGPKELEAMNVVDSRLEQTLDFSGIFSPIAKLMLKLLKWLHNYLKNFGLAIIVLTMLMRLFMLPITFRGEKSMRDFQKKSSNASARMNYLKQKHKNNPEELQRAQAELIKEQGISGLGGCLLPMLVQVPMFFALRNVLNSSLEMYQAPFLWISDLSASDPLYLLPIFAAVTMGIQMMQNPDPKQRINSLIIAGVFGAFSITFSAGLLLYFAVNTVLGLLQSYVVKLFSK